MTLEVTHYGTELALDKLGSSHFVVTQTEAFGPLSTQEVIHFLQNDKDLLIHVKWITPNGMMPVLLSEWMDDFQFDSANDNTDGLLQTSEKPLSVAHISETDSPSLAKRPSLMRSSGLSRKLRALTGVREIVALLGLGLLGALILATGVRSLKPVKSSGAATGAMQARLLGATPDSLRVYQQLLEGKIARQPERYTRALLKLFKDKELYPVGQLPSLEFIAAQGLTHLEARELDRNAVWQDVLKGLSPVSRQNGLAVVAYELSRVKGARAEIASRKPARKDRDKSVSGALEEIGIVVERLTRVVPESDPRNRVVHGLYLAKVIAQSLITVSEHTAVAVKDPFLMDAVKKIPNLYPHLKAVDKELIDAMHGYVLQQLGSTAKSPVPVVPVARLWTLHDDSKYLCQLNAYGSASDLILYMLAQAARLKQPLPELTGLFDGCFVGLRPYVDVAVSNITEEQTAELAFVQVESPDPTVLNDFRARFPTMNQALLRAQGKQSSVGDWLLALHFNGVLGSRLKLNKKFALNGRRCGKEPLEAGVCMQTLWYGNERHWKETLPFLHEVQDYVQPADLVPLVQRFVFDAAKSIVDGRSRNKAKDLAELFANLKTFGVSEDPELQIILDYARSIEGAG